MSSHGIDITGIGALSGYGWGASALWDGLFTGKAAATLHHDQTRPGHNPVWLAKVPDGGDENDGSSRFGRALRGAAREAVEDALARGWQPGRRVGLIHAVVLGEVDEWRNFYLRDGGERRVRDYLTLMPSTPVSLLMQEYGFHGPAMNVSAMCASSNAGLLTAKMWLDTAFVDDVVFVATDLSLTPENIDHFVKLGVGVVDVEPQEGCRPFQEGSRGFGMGEAATAFVLSTRSSASYARVLGGSMTHDAFHATSIDPALTQVRDCFEQALADADVTAEQVRYLNAHGPGTAQCDAAETTMLETVLDSHAQVYSVKPLTGHCQGAASAIETISAVMGFERGLVPAAPQVSDAHPLLLDGFTAAEPGLTVKSSLGMGGHNSVVVLAPA
ncbi:3-oxoacyl-ACP synthase [Rhodococcus sp. 06-470-2]|uniref:beta-ketoacyl synthase N-terminal-like domain-containing protein n=1 Tax=unclassified Rhodococcus (in: high G+C Gram-positive bacteria) TaxID=192944 RepID=UPI000B9BFFFD|nr:MULTISPECIES: beta-ketoacyl synthase N-terminal-like domain-containing protein [unclassified Rhodococcus (in: high G+C Gram-positive bacteria)]OZC59550.1 3-oxoacyl-ACP synthase [Rhodococcus sp. 06-470-2]OZE57247.1 3-oxoacyl-ACP synthase [Rhodococcus sp. 05-2221-1B]